MPIVGAPSTTAELILDPVTEDAANVEVELSDDNNIGLIAHSYPTPPAAFQWASSVSTEGAVLSSQRHENRTITLSLEVTGLGALQDLEAKIGKLYREGGTLKRTFSDSREIVFDVLTVSNYEATFEQLHHLGGVTPVTVVLECKPYGRGTEETLTSHTETTAPVLVFTETGIAGDMPALGELTVNNDQAATLQKTMLWAMETTGTGTTINPSTIPLLYEFESSYVTLAGGTALAAGPSGASGSGSNVARQTSLTTGFVTYATLATELVGTFRVFARVQVPITNTGVVQVRLRYGNLGQQTPTANTAATVADTWEGTWRLLDLGLLHAAPETFPTGSGPGAWFALIEALSSVAGDDIDFDYLLLMPVGEGSGQITDEGGISPAASATPANGSVVLTSTGVVRYGPGTIPGYATPQKYEGDWLLVPPAGAEGRGVRFVLKFSRGVISTDADSNIDDLSATLSYTPRFLVVPSA